MELASSRLFVQAQFVKTVRFCVDPMTMPTSSADGISTRECKIRARLSRKLWMSCCYKRGKNPLLMRERR